MYSVTLYILFSVRYVHVYIHTYVRKRPQIEAGQEGVGGGCPRCPSEQCLLWERSLELVLSSFWIHSTRSGSVALCNPAQGPA